MPDENGRETNEELMARHENWHRSWGGDPERENSRGEGGGGIIGGFFNALAGLLGLGKK